MNILVLSLQPSELIASESVVLSLQPSELITSESVVLSLQPSELITSESVAVRSHTFPLTSTSHPDANEHIGLIITKLTGIYCF